jgi:hypothetical protein
MDMGINRLRRLSRIVSGSLHESRWVAVKDVFRVNSVESMTVGRALRCPLPFSGSSWNSSDREEVRIRHVFLKCGNNRFISEFVCKGGLCTLFTRNSLEE